MVWKIFNSLEISRYYDETSIVVTPVRNLISESFKAVNCQNLFRLHAVLQSLPNLRIELA